MGENSAISWCDHTQNFWVGCTKVSPACDYCYAETWAKRAGQPDLWSDGHRRRTKTWGDPVRWDRKAAESGARPRVFCSSLSDFFDNEVPVSWRTEAWDVIRRTTNLRWMILTKRIGNARRMIPDDWPFPHVGLMATLANQEEWDRDIPKLMAVPAAWHGVSAEPLLGPIHIGTWAPSWLITGGESGPRNRFCDPSWIRSLRDQCARNGIAFHHKQWGGLRPKSNGCLVDGIEYKAFPAALAA
jgi:protein gp37